MKTRTHASRLALIALAAFGFAASLTAMASEAACETCRIEWTECLNSHLPQDAYVCDQRYVQCYIPLNCPISNL